MFNVDWKMNCITLFNGLDFINPLACVALDFLDCRSSKAACIKEPLPRAVDATLIVSYLLLTLSRYSLHVGITWYKRLVSINFTALNDLPMITMTTSGRKLWNQERKRATKINNYLEGHMNIHELREKSCEYWFTLLERSRDCEC